MQRFLASSLAASLLLTGCAPALSRVPMLMSTAATNTRSQKESASAAEEVVRRIPLGTNVKVRTVSGERHKGTLRAAGERTIVIEKPGPIERDAWGRQVDGRPVAVEVPYDTIQSIERDEGMGRGAKIALIAGAVAGVVVLGILIYIKAGWGGNE